MRRNVWSGVMGAVTLVCSASSAGAQGAASEEKAKAAFGEIVKRCGDAYASAFANKEKERVVELISGRYIRISSSEPKLSYDITRTQSLVSPLLGVVTTEKTVLNSDRVNSRAAAEVARLDPTGFAKETFSFALQGGAWVYKSSHTEAFDIQYGVRTRTFESTSDPKPGDVPAYACAFGAK